MEHVAALFERIGHLRSMLRPPTPGGGFGAALTAAQTGEGTAHSASHEAIRDVSTAVLLASRLGGAGTVTLGQMLGAVPASPSADPNAWSSPVAASPGSRFGLRVDPFTHETRMHKGIDFGAQQGAPIRAVTGGVVAFAGPRGGFGNLVILDHGGGLQTYYAHQLGVDVAVGDRVAAGEQIGRIGSTGRSTGPHLHFEVRRDGEAIDPAPYLGLTS